MSGRVWWMVGLLPLAVGCTGGPTECSGYAAALEACVDQFNTEGDGGLSYEPPECPAKGQEGRYEADVYACYTKVYRAHDCLEPSDLADIAVELAACGVNPEGAQAGSGDGDDEDTGYRFDSGRFIQ